MDYVMGFIIRWLTVFLQIFLLFNFVVAVVFQAYAVLRPVFKRRKTLERDAWCNRRVCKSALRHACRGQLSSTKCSCASLAKHRLLFEHLLFA